MIAEGTYTARACAGSVWESDKGALMLTLDLEITDETHPGQRLFSRQCIVQRDGTVSEITVENLRAAFGWDGADPFWFEDYNHYMDREIEIVVVHETYNGKDYAAVKYINAPGGGRTMPKSADRKTIMAKYGAKFRALSQTSAPTRTTNSAPPQPGPPTPPPTRTASTPPPAAAKVEPSDMNEAWATLCDANPSASHETLTKIWQDTIADLFKGKDNSDLTPEDWGIAKLKFEDDVPY